MIVVPGEKFEAEKERERDSDDGTRDSRLPRALTFCRNTFAVHATSEGILWAERRFKSVRGFHEILVAPSRIFEWKRAAYTHNVRGRQWRGGTKILDTIGCCPTRLQADILALKHESRIFRYCWDV